MSDSEEEDTGTIRDRSRELTASNNNTSSAYYAPHPATRANTVSRNVLEYAKRLGVKTKLHAEQQEKLNSFAANPPATQEMKIFSLLLTIQQQQEDFITTQAPWGPSDELIANIQNYTIGVLLPSQLATYKGVVLNNYVTGILKRYRFDLPAGIERNHGRWAKAKIKKALHAGTDGDDHQEHLNIFKLTEN
ncbi:uncharacterized protein PHACADRAFT_202249 [Phanerochaete carnosa HHB-10118-sp]|uniref:Uncharacterized protein n=1 Tax=Phanerochaete carnosa (strain HHB-10118-sp) TaxID=650164 RepID=K5WFF8_PHACS|nr:uncharacterized protein PHACADRAFT_202249 [Phanerochaete carnosa HHB-10118-sp]EKM48907.1 hypothetical protein PHACADRAFT_202249 [Phanerochaete carnosa HHB-10118-sp]